MNFLLTFTAVLCFSLIYCQSDETTEADATLDHSDDDYDEVTNGTTNPETTTTAAYFSEMPENIEIVYVDPESLIKYDNKGEVIMGLSDEHCDNGRVRHRKMSRQSSSR